MFRQVSVARPPFIMSLLVQHHDTARRAEYSRHVWLHQRHDSVTKFLDLAFLDVTFFPQPSNNVAQFANKGGFAMAHVPAPLLTRKEVSEGRS
jgi:hypothetical protein